MPRDLPLNVLAVLALVGDFALVLTGHDVPPLIETLSTVTIGAAAGAAIPKRGGA